MNPIAEDNRSAEREPRLRAVPVSTNSSIAWRHPRCASAEVRLLRTADFAWSKSPNRRTVLGLGRVRFEESLRDIVHAPPQPRYDVLLTSSTLQLARHSPTIEDVRNCARPFNLNRQGRLTARTSSGCRLHGYGGRPCKMSAALCCPRCAAPVSTS